MKLKKIIIPAALLLASAVSFQSCIGSFSLTNKVLTWNKHVSNKFVNEVVFFAFWVLPVYEVTAAADLLVINSIEFWSGNKPLEAKNQVIKTDNGDYKILVSENGYKVNSPDGNVISFDFDKENQVWSMATDNGQKIDFLRFIDESHISVIGSEGKFVDVELTEEGVENYKYSMRQPLMALVKNH